MSDYIDLRGHQVYSYEWENNGEAVVLLHGGLSQTSHWDYILIPALEDNFHIFAYDRTAQGFTADRPGSLHFEFQTKEAISYLEDAVKEPAHLIGYSDGGIIALMVAIQRPELVKSIVVIGANYHYSAPLSDFAEAFVSEQDQAEYNLTSPDEPHTLLEKIVRMNEIWKTEPDISLSDIASIQCPVLVMAGDDDVIKHDHTISLYEALPLGQLAIIPGTSHGLVKEKPALMLANIMQFLEDLTYPQTRQPIRRISNQPE
ncbi:MAG: alpha/beta hydrolase [Candidatus Planktophila sp.]|jgi:pimeloyl-ACP methyl ester carboxylesterase|nr:alpha/beta hydrolase [Candidatus Planktophila sp.]